MSQKIFSETVVDRFDLASSLVNEGISVPFVVGPGKTIHVHIESLTRDANAVSKGQQFMFSGKGHNDGFSFHIKGWYNCLTNRGRLTVTSIIGETVPQAE